MSDEVVEPRAEAEAEVLPGPQLEEDEKSGISELAPGDAEVLEEVEVVDVIAPEPEPKKSKVKVPVVPEVKSGKFPAPVRLDALVFRARMKNSQSVRLVQQALREQGYDEAGKDVQGWLCEGTQAALARFQAEHGLVGSGDADEATIEALFAGSATHYWER